MPETYIKRLADGALASALRRSGAVLIEGAKGCGKTKTAQQFAASSIQLELDPQVADMMEVDPSLVLLGEKPRLLDEWQIYPILWDAVRRDVDATGVTGSYLLTGSTAPSELVARHSGAGRFSRVRMTTLTFSESGDSTDSVSFAEVLDGGTPRAAAPSMTIFDLIERMCKGGWPGYHLLPLEDAMENLRDYVSSIVEVDVRTPDQVRRDPVRVRRLVRSLARGVATEISVSSLAKDSDLSRDIVRDYLDALSRIFIAVDQPAWSSHLRSKATLRSTPKRHLVDPGLAVAALETNPARVLKDLNFAGQLFESQVVHDVAAYLGRDATVSHARDSTGREVDLIVERRNGRWALIEVKLGSRSVTVEKAAKSLYAFKAQLDLSRFEFEPELIVITGGGPSYRRPDGVSVVAFPALTA